MVNSEYLTADLQRIFAALTGRECGMIGLIDELMELVQECSDMPRKLHGLQQMKVLDEEISMLLDFRKQKMQRAIRELEEIRDLKKALINSSKDKNYTGFNHE